MTLINKSAVRTQNDNKQDEYSAADVVDATDSPDNPDRTRQEFAEDTDVNVILRRFGVTGSINQRQPQFGEVDYDVGLMEHRIAQSEARDGARRAWHRASPELRKEYPTPEALMRAIAEGKLTDEQRHQVMGTTPPTRPAPEKPEKGAPPGREEQEKSDRKPETDPKAPARETPARP